MERGLNLLDESVADFAAEGGNKNFKPIRVEVELFQHFHRDCSGQ